MWLGTSCSTHVLLKNKTFMEDQWGSHCSTETEQLSTTGAFSWCKNTQADFISIRNLRVKLLHVKVYTIESTSWYMVTKLLVRLLLCLYGQTAEVLVKNPFFVLVSVSAALNADVGRKLTEMLQMNFKDWLTHLVTTRCVQMSRCMSVPTHM